MVKGNGSDINDDEILSDVEIVYALAKIKHFKDTVQKFQLKDILKKNTLMLWMQSLTIYLTH